MRWAVGNVDPVLWRGGFAAGDEEGFGVAVLEVPLFPLSHGSI